MALVMDADGVVSPIHGSTAWGDDVEAGQLFGPLWVSPSVCRRLDQLASLPHVLPVWLTSWPPDFRQAMSPFPGQDWPDAGLRTHNPDAAGGWWKWNVLWDWLSHHDRIDRLAWCDDHLTPTHLAHVSRRGDLARRSAARLPDNDDECFGPVAIRSDLELCGITPLLIAPETTTGLTPAHLETLERFVRRES
jgi:hypothetical protein